MESTYFSLAFVSVIIYFLSIGVLRSTLRVDYFMNNKKLSNIHMFLVICPIINMLYLLFYFVGSVINEIIIKIKGIVKNDKTLVEQFFDINNKK